MKRPNILFITTDQQRLGMLGSDGDAHVRTPALDRLAADGASFGLNYCANPVCVPSRYALVSGHMPHVFEGIEVNYKADQSRQPVVASCVSTPPMGWILRRGGYETFYGGKLHVQGFERYTPEAEPHFGFRCLTSDQREELAQEAARFLLERRGGEPFFLWVSFINPHDICAALDKSSGKPKRDGVSLDALPPLPPNFAPTRDEARWMTRFRDGTLGNEQDFEIGLNRGFGRRTASWTEEDWRVYRAIYRSHMSDVDRQIGIVLDALRRSGLKDDTVVVFTSDHGDHDAEHRLTMKRSFYEPSVHTPLIVSWPGMPRPGSRDNDHLVCNALDLIPTFCDFAGIEVPRGLDQGRSLRPLIEGPSAGGWRDSVVSETVGGRMLRGTRYKYMVLHDGASEEMLFDMQLDPGETQNLAGDSTMRAVVSEHRGRLADWAERERDAKGQRYLASLG